MKKLFFLFIILPAFLYSQQWRISGVVKDKETGLGLTFANIRVLNSFTGTAANKNGNYEIKLKAGKYLLAASYIGYYSDTIEVDLNQDLSGIDFYLDPSKVELQEIVIRPGENPAVAVIKKAIEKKNSRNSIINSYQHEAYTKGIIKTDQEINAKGRGVNLSLGDSDSSNLFITGIVENQSIGYFRKPDEFKEIITARKQTSNLPSSINILTGGRLMQNFYDEDINFLGNELRGPIADDALDYYYYYIENMDAINNIPVYKIHITPDDRSDPGFAGYIYITDSTYDLIQVNLQLNRAANVGGIFDTISVFQQFNKYDGIYMPGDYRLYATANFLNLAKVGFELNTILYDYKINEEIREELFNKAIVTVLPEADYKDSLYWQSSQTIPGTDEELFAYRRIDSISSVPVSFWDDFSFLSTRIGLGENFSITGPLALYHFNSVEGHSPDFGIFADDLLRERLSSSLFFSYGFADKRFKTDFNAEYLFGIYRTGEINLNLYKKTKVLFGESVGYNELTSTILALLSKYEFRDYYYSTGGGISISDEIFPVLRLSLGYDYVKDISADKNTEYSFFARDKKFKENQHVTNSEINSLSAGFKIDFRNYIEDGLYRRRTSQGKSYILLGGGVKISDDELLKTTNDFTQFNMNIDGQIRSFRSTSISYSIYGLYTRGDIPYQMLYALPGNIDLTAVDNSFRTLNVNEVTGDRVVTANVEYNFRDEIFRMLKIPILKDAEIQFKIFLNSAVSYISGSSAEHLGIKIKEFKYPFYETGFTLGHVLFPIEFSFSWKINYRDGNNFRFGIGSFIY